MGLATSVMEEGEWDLEFYTECRTDVGFIL